MKYVQRTTKNIRDNFLKSLLIDRGTIPPDDSDYWDKFFNPTKNNLLNPLLLDNIEPAADMIEYHIRNGNKIYIIVDCD